MPCVWPPTRNLPAPSHAGESEQAIDCLRCEGTGVEPCMLCGYAPADRIVDDGLPVCSACAEPAGPTVHDTLPAPAPLQDVMLIEDVRPWLTPRQTIAIARKAGER